MEQEFQIHSSTKEYFHGKPTIRGVLRDID